MNTSIILPPTLHEKLKQLAPQIGHTPLFSLDNLHENPKVKILAKAEWKQFSGSVKARAAFNIIKQALLQGKLTKDKVLLDATSGNTGIAYAHIGKALGIPVTLVLPENASKERKEILSSLGVEVIYSSRFGGTDEAQELAAELAEKYPDKYFYANQYTNENNWKAHYAGTAEEIIAEVPEITHFVAGLGTTGTFIGTSRRLKEINPQLVAVSLQPDLALHGLEGWKHLETAIIPTIYDSSVADANLEIETTKAYEIIQQVYRQNGLLLSPSSAANIAGALQLAEKIEKGTIVTILPDNADRYSEITKQLI